MTSAVLMAQTGDLKLLDWQPVSQMVVKETKIVKAKFPVIDIHSHLGKLENTSMYLEENNRPRELMQLLFPNLYKHF